MNQDIAKLSTIRITCNGDIGTAVIYFPDPDEDYVYIFTAKHCLMGQHFEKQYVKEGIVLDKIFNEETTLYHSYTLKEADIVKVSDDAEDIALLILSKKDILALTGKQFFWNVIDTNITIEDYTIRGFASFNLQQADRPFPLVYLEDQKDNTNLFTLRSHMNLDTYYQQAMENVEGLSGSGAISLLHGNTYLTGIITTFEDGNVFTATKILAYNSLIPAGKFKLINIAVPETDLDVIKSYLEMDKNREAVNTRTKETVGHFNVPRENTKLVSAIHENRLVVVHGKPGAGKSALTKSAVAKISTSGEHSVITFTAENLYADTLDKALKNAGYHADMQQIIKSPLSGKRILFWIESFEKVVESGQSGAFNELLRLINGNSHLTAVITVREYLLPRFRIEFNFEIPDSTYYYPVGEFSDDEMQLVRGEFPSLIPLLENKKIEHLLHNPYYLDRAARIIPVLIDEPELDEIKFKNLMWKHIVENNKTLRGIVFYNICLKRANEMSLFTTYTEHNDILQELVADNILQTDNDDQLSGYSPSHDILEDWALMRYIQDEKNKAIDGNSFLTPMQNAPAIKRAFRLWMEEFFRTQADSSVSFVHTLLHDSGISESWKHELLMVSLRSAHCKVLMDTLKDKFLQDKGRFLELIIYLLETGCRKIDPKQPDFNNLVPLGSGWDYIIDFIKDNHAEIQTFPELEPKYLLLVENWAKQLPDFNPTSLPPAAKSAAWLLEDYIQRNQHTIGRYQRRLPKDSAVHRYIKILFKLTAADKALISPMIHAAHNPLTASGRWTDPNALGTIRHYIADEVIGDQICRFFPDDVLKIATENWQKKEPRPYPKGLKSLMIHRPDKSDFGLDEHIDNDYDFPSAYQTFFYWMFLYHPAKALEFLITFLNNAFEINQEAARSLSIEVENVSLTFEDGTQANYYGNAKYWGLFRGFKLYSRLISSLLMALEAGLIDLSLTADHTQIQSYIQKLIKESNNVAVLAAVSSVIQASPELLDKVSVSILSDQRFYLWDLSRCLEERSNKAVYNRNFFEGQERRRSNTKVHRTKYRLGLISFVPDYIFHFKTLSKVIYKYIDAFWGSVHPSDSRWRKFLFDMDLRKYEVTPIEGYDGYIQIAPVYDDDVKTNIIDNPETNVVLPRIDTTWADKAFKKNLQQYDYRDWKTGYDYIQSKGTLYDPFTSPGTMAVLGLRDFMSKLSEEEISWCQQTIISSAAQHISSRDPWDEIIDLFSKETVLEGLPFLFNSKLSADMDKQVKELIFVLLLKQLDLYQSTALNKGISDHLYAIEPDYAVACWYGLLSVNNYELEINGAQQHNEWDLPRKRVTTAENDEWYKNLITSVITGTIDKPDEITITMNPGNHRYLDDALQIIPYDTKLPAQQQMVQQLLDFHIAYVNSTTKYYEHDFDESRLIFSGFYPKYLLAQPLEKSKQSFKQLLDYSLATEDKDLHALIRFLKENLRGLIYAVDVGASAENFWALWTILKEWTTNNLKAYFLSILLLDIEWSKNTDNWKVLKGKNLFFKELVLTFGYFSINSTIKLLSGAGFHGFMPDSVSWIKSVLEIVLKMNMEQIDIAQLEDFTEKAIYKYGNSIKKNKKSMRDLLFILEFLIQLSSAKAYLLHDELLQYKVD